MRTLTFKNFLVFGKDKKGETKICRDFDTLSEAEEFATQYVNELEITIFKKEKELDTVYTLREYMQQNEGGAYHNFIFDLGKIKVNVIGVDDFETYYNKDILDRFYVISDEQHSSGDNCTNYNCDHYLKLQMIQVDKWRK